ncbi:MAG: serpin family protein [Sandaracinaceae bacterium]
MMRSAKIFACAVAATLSFGCGAEPSSPSPAAPEVAEREEEAPESASENESEAVDEEPAAEGPPAPEADQARAFAAANNRFAVDFWSRVRTRPGNQVVSPASISLALAMTYGGAASETAEEMSRTMHFDALPGDSLHEAAGSLLAQWNDPDREAYQLAIVNRLFGEATYTFEPPFLDLTRTHYRAPLEATDFIGGPEAARGHINGWVAEQTHDRIEDLIPSGNITDQTRLALVNAVYFLGEWDTPFPRTGTRPVPFHVAGGAAQNVPMMHLTGSLRYAETDAVQLVELPYQGNEIAMLVAVPRAEDGLESVSASLSVETLDGWVRALRPGLVAMAMPRVRVAPEESMELSPILLEMGMRLPFRRGEADFTAMADPPDPADRLYISAVFHKAFVDIDEQGTEAAAATAVVMGRGGGRPSSPDATVTADRPYLFFLRDVRSGTVLFMGRVLDPR